MRRRVCIRPRFYLFIIAATILCFGISCGVAQLRYAEARERVAALYEQKAALTERVAELSERLDYVRTDAYVERVARDELNMLRPGEIRYVSNA